MKILHSFNTEKLLIHQCQTYTKKTFLFFFLCMPKPKRQGTLKGTRRDSSRSENDKSTMNIGRRGELKTRGKEEKTLKS